MKYFLALMLGAAISGATAGETNVNVAKTVSLIRTCTEQNDDSLKELCAIYFTGFLDAYSLAFTSYARGAVAGQTISKVKFSDKDISSLYAGTNQFFGCVFDKEKDQLIATFVKWAEKNPERWHKPIAENINEAFASAFPPPC